MILYISTLLLFAAIFLFFYGIFTDEGDFCVLSVLLAFLVVVFGFGFAGNEIPVSYKTSTITYTIGEKGVYYDHLWGAGIITDYAICNNLKTGEYDLEETIAINSYGSPIQNRNIYKVIKKSQSLIEKEDELLKK